MIRKLFLEYPIDTMADKRWFKGQHNTIDWFGFFV